MKALVAFVLAIGLLVGCGAAPQPVNPFQKARAATFALGVERGDEVVTFCSAVQIDLNKFLTAAHCTAEDIMAYSPGVVDKDGVVHQFTVVARNEETDVALLTAQVGDPHIVYLAVNAAALDEAIMIVGYPLNEITHQQVLTTGRAGETRGDEPFQLAVANATFGNSGGPVFVVRNGIVMVVGIMSQTTIISFYGFPNQHQYLSWFAPLQSLKDLINAATR